jgi:hypothetical protein
MVLSPSKPALADPGGTFITSSPRVRGPILRFALSGHALSTRRAEVEREGGLSLDYPVFGLFPLYRGSAKGGMPTFAEATLTGDVAQRKEAVKRRA